MHVSPYSSCREQRKSSGTIRKGAVAGPQPNHQIHSKVEAGKYSQPCNLQSITLKNCVLSVTQFFRICAVWGEWTSLVGVQLGWCICWSFNILTVLLGTKHMLRVYELLTFDPCLECPTRVNRHFYDGKSSNCEHCLVYNNRERHWTSRMNGKKPQVMPKL